MKCLGAYCLPYKVIYFLYLPSRWIHNVVATRDVKVTSFWKPEHVDSVYNLAKPKPRYVLHIMRLYGETVYSHHSSTAECSISSIITAQNLFTSPTASLVGRLRVVGEKVKKRQINEVSYYDLHSSVAHMELLLFAGKLYIHLLTTCGGIAMIYTQKQYTHCNQRVQLTQVVVGLLLWRLKGETNWWVDTKPTEMKCF